MEIVRGTEKNRGKAVFKEHIGIKFVTGSCDITHNDVCAVKEYDPIKE